MDDCAKGRDVRVQLMEVEKEALAGERTVKLTNTGEFALAATAEETELIPTQKVEAGEHGFEGETASIISVPLFSSDEHET